MQKLSLSFEVDRAWSAVPGRKLSVLSIGPGPGLSPGGKVYHAAVELAAAPSVPPADPDGGVAAWGQFAQHVWKQCCLSGFGQPADAAPVFGKMTALKPNDLDSGGEFTLELTPNNAQRFMPQLESSAAAGKLSLGLLVAADWRPGGRHLACCRIQISEGLKLCSGSPAGVPGAEYDVHNMHVAGQGCFGSR